MICPKSSQKHSTLLPKTNFLFEIIFQNQYWKMKMPFLLGLQRIMIPKNSSQKRHFKKALCHSAHPYILFRALLHILFLISDFHFWNQFFHTFSPFHHSHYHSSKFQNVRKRCSILYFCANKKTSLE